MEDILLFYNCSLQDVEISQKCPTTKEETNF